MLLFPPLNNVVKSVMKEKMIPLFKSKNMANSEISPQAFLKFSIQENNVHTM